MWAGAVGFCAVPSGEYGVEISVGIAWIDGVGD